MLTDDKGRMYIWDEDGYMVWAKDEELEGMTDVEEKVEWVLSELWGLEVEPVWRDYHPAEDTDNLKEMREGVSRYYS